MKMLFISGFLGAETDWDFLDKAFPREDRLSILPGSRVFTESEEKGLPENAWRLICDRFVFEELPRFLKTGEKCLVVGYSLGGRMAVQLVDLFPQYFKGMMALSTHPGLTTDAERSERRLQDQLWSARFGSPTFGPAGSGPDVWKQIEHDWNQQAVFLKDERRAFPEPTKEFQKRCELQLKHLSLGHQADMRPSLIKSSVPQLWVTGSLDTKFSNLASELSRASEGRIRHVLQPGGGHRWPWTAPPEEVSKLVKDFVLELNGTGNNRGAQK